MISKALNNEQELLLKVSLGMNARFSLVVTHYTSIIYAHLLIYLKNVHKAEEATQDIFMSIWRNRNKLPGMDNFAGYLYVITRNRLQTLITEKVAATVEPPAEYAASVADQSGIGH